MTSYILIRSLDRNMQILNTQINFNVASKTTSSNGISGGGNIGGGGFSGGGFGGGGGGRW